MKADLTPGIQNPHKIHHIIVQTIANFTTDIEIMKQIADTEMIPIYRTIKKLLSSIQKVLKKIMSPQIISLFKYRSKNRN